MRKYKSVDREVKRIALERINVLMKKAEEVFKEDNNLANRYVSLCRKISMKTKVPVPRDLKRKFCRHCYKFLRIGSNCTVRTAKGKVVYHCEECGKIRRYVYK